MNWVRKQFVDAIEKGNVRHIRRECIAHRVPIHLGGLSDPFQECERQYRATYEFLNITKAYKYPVNISTKTSFLEDMYWDVLDPQTNTFSISIMGSSDEYVKLWERNTPTADERIRFVKELKQRGFFVSIRIQPIIDMDEVLELISRTENFVDFYTVEHLKLPVDNAAVCQKLLKKMNGVDTRLVAKGREYEFDTITKIKNIETIKKATKVKIGYGDNDLHVMSDTLNCCGIDTMPSSFKNWMKYNTMYIKMTGDRSQWAPQARCEDCLNGDCVIKGLNTMNRYVDKAYIEQYGDPRQMTLFD